MSIFIADRIGGLNTLGGLRLLLVSILNIYSARTVMTPRGPGPVMLSSFPDLRRCRLERPKCGQFDQDSKQDGEG